MSDPYGFDDPGYQEFLDECAKHCRCCSCCRNPPCDGVMAGGLCDGVSCVFEREELDEDDLDEQEDDRIGSA